MSSFFAARRGITRLLASTALALVGLGAGPAVVMAYPKPPGSGTLGSGVSPVQQGTSNCPFTFRFVDANQQPSSGAPVSFSVGGVSGASVNPTSGTTDANGVASTCLVTTSGCGTATLTATSGAAIAQTSVNVVCAGAAGIALPNTSTGVPHPSPWAIVVAAFAVLVMAAGGIGLRKTRHTQ